MNGRQLLLGLGIVAFGAGVAELIVPGLSPLPGDESLLTVFGIVTLLYAFAVFYARHRHSPERIETPDVEIPEPTTVAGTDLEATLERFPGVRQVYAGVFSTVQDGLRKAAVAILTRYEGVSTERARERIEAGSWTADPYAAAFLSETGLAESSIRERVHRFVSADSYRHRGRQRTVDAIAEKANVSPAAEEMSERDRRLLADDIETGTRHRLDPDEDGGQIRRRKRTHHWTGVSIVALVCLGLGLLFAEPSILLAGTAGIGYAAYSRTASPRPVDLTASRSLSETDPEPGDDVEVTVTVTNDGGFCPDLRIVDGVPERLAVSSGSPRYGTAVRAGESVSFSYTISAKQGVHEFGPVLVIARDLPGTTEQETLLSTATSVRSVPAPQPAGEPVPLRRRPSRYAGQTATDTGGEGIEFQTVREYQPGDSMTRIDWNRRARTGELTTLEFRRERSMQVVLLIDSRPDAFVGHAPSAKTAVERAVDAAQRLFPRLLADGHRVGIAAFGPDDCYLPPDSGQSHTRRGRELLATTPAFHSRREQPKNRPYWDRQLRQKLPDGAQLLVITPLLDSSTIRKIRQFEAYGYLPTILSPDPTTTQTPSHRLMRACRQFMLADLRQTGIPVFEWGATDSLDAVLKREAIER